MLLRQLLQNRHLVAVGASWLAAQVLKPVLYLATHRKWDWHWFFSPGGMPSAHCASVSALATAVGLLEGVGSPLFALALVMAIVVFYDAAGVRRSAGLQAKVLNEILEELFSGRPIAEEHLRELIGHTPFEVLIGASLGVVITLLLLR